MIIKEFRELRRDRRTVAMLVVLPVLLLVMFGYAANFSLSSLRTVAVGPQAGVAQAKLPPLFDVVSVRPDSRSTQAQEVLKDADAQVVIDTSTTPFTAWVDGADLFAAQTATGTLARAGNQVDVHVLFNPDLKTSWYMVPALIGLIMTFIGTIITSIGLVRERETGTLEQLAVMPFRPSDVILGKIAPYFLLAGIDLIVVTVLGILVFGVPFIGNLLIFALGAGLFLFVVLGLGVLISTLSQSQGQAIQGSAARPATSSAALRNDLSPGRDAVGRTLAWLLHAAVVLHDGQPRHHAARHADHGDSNLASAAGTGRDGHGHLHLGGPAVPSRPGPDAPCTASRDFDRGGPRCLSRTPVGGCATSPYASAPASPSTWSRCMWDPGRSWRSLGATERASRRCSAR